MSSAVAKAFQLSTFVRNIFGMCPFHILSASSSSSSGSGQPRLVARITLLSAYLPVLLCLAMVTLFCVASLQMMAKEKMDGTPVLDEDLFGSSGVAFSGSVTFVVLGMTMLTNALTYVYLILVTFLKRDSWLRIFQDTLKLIEKLQEKYEVKCHTLRLRVASEAVLAAVLVYHGWFVYQFWDVLSGNIHDFAMPLVYIVWTYSATLSTLDLIISLQLLREIFHLLQRIPANRYDTEMFLSFFKTLDLMEEISQCHGLREVVNIGNQQFIILSQLFVLVYQIESFAEVNFEILFGTISVIPRAVNLIALAIFGSLLSESVGGCKWGSEIA